MTTSGPWPPTPHGSDVFDRLWAACLDCGSLEPTVGCAGCGVPGRPAPRGGGQAGSRLWFLWPDGDGRAPSLRGATLVESGGRWLTTIHDEGEARVDEDGTEYAWWTPPAGDSAAEQLLVAAIHWRLPEVAARAVRSRARQQLDEEDRPQVLRFAAIATANGDPELLDGLDLRPATRTWFEVLALARVGHDVAACQQALLLRGGVFPARLGLWARAAGQLPDELRAAILARLADFRGNVEVDAAVAATRQALTGRTAPPTPPPTPAPATTTATAAVFSPMPDTGATRSSPTPRPVPRYRDLDGVPRAEVTDPAGLLATLVAATEGWLAADVIEPAPPLATLPPPMG